MASLNGYNLEIPEGKEDTERYVSLEHNQTYTISIRNNRSTRCKASLTVDGKDIGDFMLNPYQESIIEHPVGDDGRFTAFKKSSEEFNDADGSQVTKSDRGVITCEFRPEQIVPQTTITSYPVYVPVYIDRPYRRWWDTYQYWNTTSGMTSLTAQTSMSLPSRACDEPEQVITGLTGKSNQIFQHQDDDLNYSGEVVSISLRLICQEKPEKKVRPLKPSTSKLDAPQPV